MVLVASLLSRKMRVLTVEVAPDGTCVIVPRFPATSVRPSGMLSTALMLLTLMPKVVVDSSVPSAFMRRSCELLAIK